jgi:hypothetical protein
MNALILAKKEDSPKMKIKKQMLRRVLLKAWFYRNSKGFNKNKALKEAWKFEKTKVSKIQKNQFSLI